ncbi:hypothetical protein MPL3365_80005 [Mesorhizobium plurifarium]|uniref:Uncharacterized protein n=1 Tax=Mesorhizobium plurifarium TaxID=69974 RepID=A0A090GW92_MESPL|nr:hypothetical protein MPL3365_80005 [Mesorhizobium plurifarium]
MALEVVEVEFDHAAVRPADFLGFQIDRQRRVGAARGVVHQLVEVFRADGDRQDAVLEAVVVEDVGERGRDHAADAEVEQRPGRVLAARAAAEIVAGDQDLRLAVGRLVEHEIRVLRTVLVVAHLGEQAGAEPGALDRLEIILRDDHVGVDIDDRHGRGDARELGEFVHGYLPVFLACGEFCGTVYTKPAANERQLFVHGPWANGGAWLAEGLDTSKNDFEIVAGWCSLRPWLVLPKSSTQASPSSMSPSSATCWWSRASARCGPSTTRPGCRRCSTTPTWC